MPKMKPIELLKTAGAYAIAAGTTIDAALLLAERTGTIDISPSWYINGPLIAYTLVGLPVSITLAERLIRQADDRPGRIKTVATAGTESTGRAIPLNRSGQASTLMVHSANSPFADQAQTYHPVAWRVPIGENEVTVREAEVKAFLEVAWKRRKYQFSRRYWTEKRRPPMWRDKYEAIMELLIQAGLVEGRTYGASGRLIVFPRAALFHLKYESQFAL